MFKKAFRKIAYSKQIAALLILNTIIILAIFFLQSYLPPVVPLFYGLPKGADQLAPSIVLTVPPVVAITTILISVLLISITKDDFTKKILIATSAITTLLSLITVIKITLLVSSL